MRDAEISFNENGRGNDTVSRSADGKHGMSGIRAKQTSRKWFREAVGRLETQLHQEREALAERKEAP